MSSKNKNIVQINLAFCKIVATVVLLFMLNVLLVCNREPNNSDPKDPVVVGSIDGVILKNSGTCSEGPIGPNIWVYWTSNEELDSVVTDNLGYFRIEGLSSGEYILNIVYVEPEVEGEETVGELYSPVSCNVTILNLDDLTGDIDITPYNEYLYNVTLGLNAPKVYMYENSASVSGKLLYWLYGQPYSQAIPAPGVEINLVYPEEYDDDYFWEHKSFTTMTDSGGDYLFENIPVFDGEVEMNIPSFVDNHYPFDSFYTNINLECNSGIIVDDIIIYSDCRQVPTVLSYNFPNEVEFYYDSDLIIEFSEPMDTLSFEFALLEGSDIVPTTYSWNDNDSILTIDPVQVLKTETDFTLELYKAFSKTGCELASQFSTLHFTTMDGIRLLYTNVETSPGSYTDFPIDEPIMLTFNMPPILDPTNSILTLVDLTFGGVEYLVAIDTSIDGNVISIMPEYVLEMSHTYKICYRVYSSIPGDYDDSCITFDTEFDIPPPLRVDLEIGDSNFRADWNTNSVPLKWAKVNRVQYYFIYAYDNASEHPNTDFVLIDSVEEKDYLQYHEKIVTIPSQFDRYFDDAIQTPFSDNTSIYFMARAGHRGGLGPHSDTVEVRDTTPPGGGNGEDGGNDNLSVYFITGSADNVNGTQPDTVWLNLLTDLEYMQNSDNPIFSFVEAGGDDTYTIPNTNGVWSWDDENRHNDFENIEATGAFFTTPAGECGAGDSLYLTFYDNSGNDTTVQLRIPPYIEFISPLAGNDFEADDLNIDWLSWTITDLKPPHQTSYVDYYLSLDGGLTFIDSFVNFGDGSYSEDPELSSQWMSDGNARIKLIIAGGGCQWWSDYFTINGILLTGPDSATYAEMDPIYDAEGNDSTAIPITWDYVGIDSVGIWYEEDGGSWVLYDSVANTGIYNFYAPDLGYNYDCRIAVADLDTDNLPIDSITWYFNVVND